MFNQFKFYQLHEDYTFNAQAFNEGLSQNPLVSIQPQSSLTMGWVTPFSDGSEMYLMSSNRCHGFRLEMEMKILPAAAINRELKQRVRSFNSLNGHSISRKGKADLKSQIYLEMLPNAPVKNKVINAFIDEDLHMLVIGCATDKDADDVLTNLRQTFGSFRATPIDSSMTRGALTNWAMNDSNIESFNLGCEITLKTFDEDKSSVSCRNLSLVSDQVERHLESGFQVESLGMSFLDRSNFVLDHKGGIKKFKLTDVVMDQLEDDEIESENDRISSTFTLYSSEIRALNQSLVGRFLS